ncbi:MAG: hypothetical protein JNK43_08025 [Ignavibacteria bacterium]|nr:hypothetical protein [Ignavibacteria bacterium]
MRTIVTITLAFVLCASNSFSQDAHNTKNGKFYMGFGTSVSSFLGGEFGKVYALRLNYSPDYYDNYNSYNYNSYDGYDSYFMYSPIQLDVNAGYMVNDKLSLEMESSFIWHLRGRPDPEFVTGTEGNNNYIDKYDNSTLFAVPLVVNAKFYPAGRKQTPFYIKAGAGFQYVSESSERVREYYTYTVYDPLNEDRYYHYSATNILAEYSRMSWLPGFKIGAGISYTLLEDLNAFTEIEYSYFKNNPKGGESPLALNKARYAGLLAINTKVYFSF